MRRHGGESIIVRMCGFGDDEEGNIGDEDDGEDGDDEDDIYIMMKCVSVCL